MTQFPVRYLVSDPGGTVPLSAERAETFLPRGPEARETALRYGPYLYAVKRFLERDGWSALLGAMERHTREPLGIDAVRGLRIVSEKHGGAYHVARAVVERDSGEVSFAVNCATDVLQKSQAAMEIGLLESLQRRFDLPHLPKLHAKGEADYVEEEGTRRTLSFFITEWFEDFHEFHLTLVDGEEVPRIVLWDTERGGRILGAGTTARLYERASAILTAYFDPGTFEQIYPWHHAAGDFVVRETSDGPEVRLVTARGYRSLFTPGADPGDLWIALTHFFLNLTLRMRMDRLDGTGDMVLADAGCLDAVLRGFLGAWEQKAEEASGGLPDVADVLGIFRSFSSEELLSLLVLVLEDGSLHPVETTVAAPHLMEHTEALQAIFRRIDG